jgi:hypothetical protein
MRARHFLVTVALVGALAGCGGGDNDQDTAAASEPAATSAAADVPGIPPAPDAETQTAYIAALRAIDPDIVGDKDPKTIVNRGRDQCSSIPGNQDEAKLVDLTNKRFTSPDHPDGFGDAKSKRILATVRKYICPSY